MNLLALVLIMIIQSSGVSMVKVLLCFVMVDCCVHSSGATASEAVLSSGGLEADWSAEIQQHFSTAVTTAPKSKCCVQ